MIAGTWATSYTDYGTTSTTGTDWDEEKYYVRIYADDLNNIHWDEFHDYGVPLHAPKKKKQKKPFIAEDAAMPMYRLEKRPIHKPVQILNRRSMFDKSGYLPKKIRRIRKCQHGVK